MIPHTMPKGLKRLRYDGVQATKTFTKFKGLMPAALAKVEGVVSEFAKAIAGGLILVLGLLAVFNLISYYYILIPIIAGWIYVTGKLYNKYRDKIKEKLESHENVGAGEESLIQKIFAGLERGLARIRSDKAIFHFKLMEKINPGYTGGKRPKADRRSGRTRQ